MLDLFKGRNELEDKGFLFRILQLACEEYLWQLEENDTIPKEKIIFYITILGKKWRRPFKDELWNE